MTSPPVPPRAACPAELPWTAWKPAPDDVSWSATCDWGDCDVPTVTVRWEDRLKRWLPVCAGHAPDRDARCAALHPGHQAWECAGEPVCPDCGEPPPDVPAGLPDRLIDRFMLHGCSRPSPGRTRD